MNSSEIEYENSLTYDELCEHLQDKYGIPQDSYFSEDYKYRSADIKRTGEGLEIHHMNEIYDGCSNLSNVPQNSSFDSQKPDRLCYCNLLEHLILHIKINLERAISYNTIVYDGAVVITRRLDNLFESTKPFTQLDKNMFEPIKNNYSDYIKITNDWAKKLKQIKRQTMT